MPFSTLPTLAPSWWLLFWSHAPCPRWCPLWCTVFWPLRRGTVSRPALFPVTAGLCVEAAVGAAWNPCFLPTAKSG